jgi:hypothetical protein
MDWKEGLAIKRAEKAKKLDYLDNTNPQKILRICFL